jgi:hypothetical protein
MVVLYRRNRYNVTKQCVWDKEDSAIFPGSACKAFFAISKKKFYPPIFLGKPGGRPWPAYAKGFCSLSFPEVS